MPAADDKWRITTTTSSRGRLQPAHEGDEQDDHHQHREELEDERPVASDGGVELLQLRVPRCDVVGDEVHVGVDALHQLQYVCVWAHGRCG